jgi:hypothetical protein
MTHLYNREQIRIMQLWLGQRKVCFPLAIVGTYGSGKTILASELATLVNGTHHTTLHPGFNPELLIMATKKRYVHVLDNVASISTQQRAAIRMMSLGEGIWEKHRPNQDTLTFKVAGVMPLILTSHSNSHSGDDIERFLTPLEPVKMQRIPELGDDRLLLDMARQELIDKLAPDIAAFQQEFGLATFQTT